MGEIDFVSTGSATKANHKAICIAAYDTQFKGHFQ